MYSSVSRSEEKHSEVIRPEPLLKIQPRILQLKSNATAVTIPKFSISLDDTSVKGMFHNGLDKVESRFDSIVTKATRVTGFLSSRRLQR